MLELRYVLLVHNLEKPFIKADVVCCDLQRLAQLILEEMLIVGEHSVSWAELEFVLWHQPVKCLREWKDLLHSLRVMKADVGGQKSYTLNCFWRRR